MLRNTSRCIASLLLSAAALLAQATETPAAKPAVAVDALGRATPRGTVVGFLEAAQRENYDAAAEYLDARSNSTNAKELARELKTIIDRRLHTNLDDLSNEPEGSTSDELAPDLEKLGDVRVDSEFFPLTLQRISRSGGPPVWLFSRDTVARIHRLYEDLGIHWVEAYLPEPLLEIRILSLPLWQWIALLLAIPLGYLASSKLLYPGVVLLVRVAARRILHEQDDRLVEIIRGPLHLLGFAFSFRILLYVSGLPLLVRQFWARVMLMVTIVAVAWLILRLSDIFAEFTQRRLARVNWSGSTAMIQLSRRVFKALAVIVAALFILRIVGFDLTAVIAGLGVGGIAVALGAQKTLEHLFGGFALVSDQPIRVGDYCKAGEHAGTIEDIGLRSTRIRTNERTVLSVPNGQLSNVAIENFALRDKMWFHPVIGLRYETKADQLRYVLAEIRRMLYEHKMVESASARIRFIRFAGSSLDLEIFSYVLTADFNRFLEVQEDLLLRIMDIVEASGTSIAFDSQVSYFANDTGLDREKSEAAVAAVKRWRDRNELPFPNFSPETIAEIDNKLEFPPKESALYDGR